LRAAHERRAAVLKEWQGARRETAAHFENRSRGPAVLGELQDRSLRLREELERLRKECAGEAVAVCSMQLQAEETRERLQKQAATAYHREHLHRLEKALSDSSTGALALAVEEARTRVRTLRFQWALQAFRMHRLQVDDVEPRSSESTSRRTTVSGIGKIGGLPLPHAGPELFGVLPPDELQSALRLVASLTSLVARCLGILLPHPVLLRPPGSSCGGGDSEDIAACRSKDDQLLKQQDVASSVQSLRREGGSGRPSMDPAQVEKRLRHAVSAVLAEDQSDNNPSTYALAADKMHRDEFAVALQLLQNNVVALSIRAGVPVDNLYPAEAVLLNLHALHRYCETQAGVE
jgi:hypothetical protein